MKLAMIGAGYVGLVSGACFSEFGHQVICVDSDSRKIDMLRQGQTPIHEPGLEALITGNMAAERLQFTTDLAAAVQTSDVVFIAVGTPSRRGDDAADLSWVHGAARQIAEASTGEKLVVIKSTVPVGVGAEVKRILAEANPAAHFHLVSNPEFLREGAAIEDFMRPNRVVCGVESAEAEETMRAVYQPLYLNETPIIFTSPESAEMIKYAANCFLATKVAFINEIADLCEKLGADVQDVARGMGLDQRIGVLFLHPGPGFGGSCFPKDVRALAATAAAHDTPLRIVGAVNAANRARKPAMAEKIIQALGGDVTGRVIAILGVTFKPNTDDLRESPSLEIIPALRQAGAEIRACDPACDAEAATQFPGVTWADDAYAAMDGADAVVIMTEWNQFRALDKARMRALLKTPLMIDLRNIYNPGEMREAGFVYHSIGRAPVE